MSDELLNALERAEAGSRELNGEIWWLADRQSAFTTYWNAALGKPKPLPSEWAEVPRGLGKHAVGLNAPNFTGSLDFALTLIPDGWGFSLYGPDPLLETSTAYCLLGLPGTAEAEGKAPTLPLAVCIASLKAIQALKEKAG